MRCCAGDTHVVPNGPALVDRPATKWVSRLPVDESPRDQSWAVVCSDCLKVLCVVDGPREEVYAWL